MPLEKQSLNNFLPNGFETLNKEGCKENFSKEKIATGYEKDVPDIVSGPNLNNLIDVIGKNTNTLNNYVEYLNSLSVNKTPIIDSNNQLNSTQIGLKVYSATETYLLNDLVTTIQDGKVLFYKSLVASNTGNPLTNTDYWEEVKLGGGSGLELCDIGTALYVDETKGLRRRLNGSIMDITSNYQAFLARLKEITTLYPSLVCTETEWQTTKTMSKLGQCGKFVYNYGADGTTVTSIRLPLVININGLADMANAGLIKDESLPNVTGEVASHQSDGLLKPSNICKGAFYQGTQKTNTYAGTVGTSYALGFDASRSSSTYKNGAVVQQEAIQYPYFIQVATGQETENNIVDDIELNNPFTFGMNMYFKGEMENISWLKSANQQNPKALYPDFYNWVLTNANAGKEGFKLSTASDITDYDFEVNPTDETFRLPLKNGMEGVFASRGKGNGKALVVTDGNGNERNLFQAGNDYIFTNDNVAGNLPHVTASYNGNQTTSYALGTNVGLTTDATKSGIVVDTTVLTGYNLYYFVGVVVKNPNLIDAGRIGEELGNKLNTPPRYVVEVSDKSLMPSWYVVYNDGWCEQGGYSSNKWAGDTNSTISFLKEFLNTEYFVILNQTSGNQSANVTQRTTTSFTKSGNEGSDCWKALGYIKRRV